jgi:hypothetical protein
VLSTGSLHRARRIGSAGVRLLDILTRLGNEDDNLDLGLMRALQLGFQAGVVGGADTRVIKLPLVE